MAKLACKSCGGKVKMANGGTTPKKVLAKAQMGLMYGIPQTGTTNYSAPTMKKGGSIKKYQDGGKTGAQLKKEGEMLKAKGLAMKTKGKDIKEKGRYLKLSGQEPVRAYFDKLLGVETLGYNKKGGSVKRTMTKKK